MFNVKALMATTALVAFSTLPAQALVLEAPITLGLYTAGMVPMIDPNSTVGAATGTGSTSVPSNEPAGTEVATANSSDDTTGPASGDGATSEASTAADSTGMAVTDDSTGPATGDDVGSAPVADTGVSLNTAVIVDSGFNTDNVLDASGAQIGVVETVIQQSQGETTLIVLVNGGMATESRFTIGIDPSLQSDGTVQLPLTMDDLTAALSAL